MMRPSIVVHCSCGTAFLVRKDNWKSGHTKSCGCKRYGHRKTHGEGNYLTPEYRAWASMKRRCYNRNCSDYSNYGGRGIIVCSQWINNYRKFLSDMGRKPGIKFSLDRIDVNGNYTPENCRWTTAKVQANNRRFVEAV